MTTTSQYTCREGKFRTFDDAELFYRAWTPEGPHDRTVIILHRGHEHSGRVAHLPEELGLERTRYFCFDLRGHGQSPGPRGWAPSFDTWVQDLNSFAMYLQSAYGLKMEDTFVVANSVGSVMVTQWVHDCSPGIRGMVLAAPAFSIKLYVPFALSTLRVVTWFTNKLFVNSYVKSKLLTRDKDQARSYDADKLITKRIAISVLVSLFDSMKRLLADARAIETPTLILSAGSDYIVDNKIQRKFFDRISSREKRIVVLEGYRHALFHEIDREKVIGPIREFIGKSYDQKVERVPMVFPEAREHSVQELERNSVNPGVFKQVIYAIMRNALVSMGAISRGMSIGLSEGFDSGASLDYVYRKKADGHFGIGRLVDFVYLRATGWEGIRQRKENLRVALESALHEVHRQGKRPVVLDCAAGYGRYLFEAVSNVPFEVELHVRDLNEKNLEASKKLAAGFGVKNCDFEKVDAFDENQYASRGFEPNVVIVSGLFELYADNRLLYKALSGIKAMMAPGGFILYTGQPWHPQLELIARVLNNRNGRRWIMRARVQAELDDLVKYVGFQKIATTIDRLGIFTVSAARK